MASSMSAFSTPRRAVGCEQHVSRLKSTGHAATFQQQRAGLANPLEEPGHRRLAGADCHGRAKSRPRRQPKKHQKKVAQSAQRQRSRSTQKRHAAKQRNRSTSKHRGQR